MKYSIACLAALGLASGALANSVTLTYSGSIATGQAAQAAFTFDNTADTVTIRIANTMAPAFDSTGARDLAALFWSFTNTGTLGVTYDHAPIPNGPNANTWDATNVTSTNGGNVHGAYNAEQLWGFRNNLSGAPGNVPYGLSASGLGLFDPADMLQSGGPHPQPAGPDGTIISPTGNPFDSSRPQFRTFVQFVFGVNHNFFPQDLNTIGVNDLRVQFNTGLNSDEQVPLTVVPLPPAAWSGIGCLGVGTLAYWRRRSRNSVI